MKLLLATNNPGKRAEIQAILTSIPDLSLLTPADIGLELEIPENGTTYQENAAIKAKAFSSHSGLVSLADDSGLEVDVLGGLPGLHSARFSPRPGASDADRRALLLEKLKVYPRPWQARFRCVVALAHPDGRIVYTEGICPGEIIPQERGQNGFGYDPIFLVKEMQCTMAELEMDVKNTLSHRGRAILAALPWIDAFILHSPESSK